MKKCPKCGREYADTNSLCSADGAVLGKAKDALVGQMLTDKYRVDELLSEGGMGAVYRGTHTLMDKTVAIKVLHPALAADEKIVARFSREARAASRISHPHALSVTDFGESENGVVFLVMEYLHGKTLKEVIHDDSPLPLPRIVEIMRQVTGALEAAHGEGVVHRDLKSDNIMLVDVGGGDWAKVLDFGIAKIQEPAEQDPALTSPNLIIGTPQYMSPEQCSQAAELDARSDIYSLGVILYEMLVGHVPFTGDSPTAIMMKHLQEPPPSVLEERKDVPPAVSRVVVRALAKRPEDRFQSVGELSEALALAAENETAATSAAVISTDAISETSERDTHRIVVPTESNVSSRATANQDYDESTVVQQRVEPVALIQEEEAYRGAAVVPPPSGFNPWRIAIPALLGLMVVFLLVFAVTRKSDQANTNVQLAPLAADPNSQAVQPVPPANGQSEQTITSSSPIVVPSMNANVSSTSNATQNTNVEAFPTVANSNAIVNANQQQNANASNQNQTQANTNASTTKPARSPLPPVPAETTQTAATPSPAATETATPKATPKRTAPTPTIPPAPSPASSDQVRILKRRISVESFARLAR